MPALIYMGAPRFTPEPAMLALTLGIVVQASHLGHFIGPAALGTWVENFGWSSAPVLFATVAAIGLAVAAGLRRLSQTSDEMTKPPSAMMPLKIGGGVPTWTGLTARRFRRHSGRQGSLSTSIDCLHAVSPEAKITAFMYDSRVLALGPGITQPRKTDHMEGRSMKGILPREMRVRGLVLIGLVLLLLIGLPLAVWLDLSKLAETTLRRQATDLNSVISSMRTYYATNVVGRVLAVARIDSGGP